MKEQHITVSTLPVTGMGCAACAVKVDKALHRIAGVKEAGVNFAASTARIAWDDRQCDLVKIQEAVREAGYDLLIEEKEQAAAKALQLKQAHYRHLKRCCLGAWILWLPILAGSLWFSRIAAVRYLLWAVATVAVFGCGRDFHLNAGRQLRHLSFNMDTLVACSTGVAYLFSVFNLLFPDFWTAHGIQPHLYFETSAGLVAFILTGRTLEERAKQRTSAAIGRLIGLKPKKVTVVDGTGERKIPISRVRTGDILLVHPGERIAVDGTVTAGSSYVDESMWSGEPIPVFKEEGAKVYSGTANRDGAFRFRAEEVGENTVLSRIIALVEEAQGSRAPIQRLVDKVAGIFVPAILGIAIVTFCGWYFLAPAEGFSHGLLTMITVLIIACPCALGLATPTAIMVGIGRGAEAGILIRDAESLQTAKAVDTVILDKTGTLTEGQPEVVGILWADGEAGGTGRLQENAQGTGRLQEHGQGAESEEDGGTECLQKNGLGAESEAAAVLLGLEKLSDHPLAQAVVRALEGRVSGETAGTIGTGRTTDSGKTAETIGTGRTTTTGGNADGPGTASGETAGTEITGRPENENPVGTGRTTAARIDRFENLAGKGIRGEAGGRTWYAGNRTGITEAGLSVPAALQRQADSWTAAAHTLVWFADESRVIAVLALKDRLKPGSRAAVARLRKLGVNVCLLTGDQPAAAEAAAREAGIPTVLAGALPQEKAAYVRKLQKEGHRVAMVGDGINDSAALASADLSIAMGKGSDIAMDTAQVTILSSDLQKIPEMLRLSRAAMRTLRQNLFWAFFYNGISIPIAAGVLYPVCGLLLHPMIGGAAMALSSVSVVSNSLRLRKAKLS